MAERVMLGLGEFRFEIATAAYQKFSLNQSWRWPEQARINRDPALQFVGRNVGEIELDGVIYPGFKGGLGQIEAMRALADAGVRVNMTLVFSPTQALMAANAGARYISPFVGRFDDIAEDGISQLDNVVTCIKNYDWTGKNVDDTVEIITASVRTPNHVTQAALLGADIATVPMAALKKCLHHPLTDQGLASFEADWQKVVAQA